MGLGGFDEDVALIGAEWRCLPQAVHTERLSIHIQSTYRIGNKATSDQRGDQTAPEPFGCRVPEFCHES